jgi:putative transposase
LPAKVSQQILKQLNDARESYFEACQSYQEDPSKFTGYPKLPKYQHKTGGRNMLIYTLQAPQGGQSKKGIQGTIR